MKKILALLSCLILLMAGVPAYAEENETAEAPEMMMGELKGTCGDHINWTLGGTAMLGNTLTISGSGAMYNYDLFSNKAPWYEFRESINQVVITGSVTTIGAAAFYDCAAIESVSLQAPIESIGAHAFRRCVSLGQLTLPDEVKSIGAAAMSDTGLSSLTLPVGCEALGENALSDMQLLTALYVPKTVTTIGNGVFYGSEAIKVYCYSGSVMYQYVVNNHFPYELIDTPPAAVQGVTAKPAGANKVKIIWSAVAGAEGYLIYGRHGAAGAYQYIGRSNGLELTDAQALPSDYNYYWVFAGKKDYYKSMMYSGKSAYVYAKGVNPPVTNLKAANMVGYVRLTWDAVPEADGYLIYGIHGDQKKGATYGYIGMTTKGTTFNDKNALKTDWNFYWVFPYHTDASGKMWPGSTTGYVYGRAR